MTSVDLYLRAIRLVPERVANPGEFPFAIPALRKLALDFEATVTFFVGENGSGKSTLIEAIAALAGLPVNGGGKNEAADAFGPDEESPLAPALRPCFARRPRDGYFFRAELMAHFASLLEARERDPDFLGNPYQLYGGKSLRYRSHGEAFLALFANRLHQGFFIMDEPESALSPQRQLALLAMMANRVAAGQSQFIIATHSPVLLTFPGAQIVSFDETPVAPVRLEDTSHYQIVRGILESPERYWKHLLDGER